MTIGGSAIGLSGTADASPQVMRSEPVSHLSTLYSTVANNNSMLHSLGERMENLRNRLLGCPPQNEQAGVGATGMPEATIDALAMTLEHQTNVIVRLSNLMNELESL